MLIKNNVVGKRWAEYFERLLIVQEDRGPVIIAVERERGMNVLVELNETLIMKNKEGKAGVNQIKEMKTGKLQG